MTTLKRLYLEYNRELYGKRNGVPKKAEPAFQKVEMMLTKADISLEDYTMTTFADRIWIGCKLGHVPWTVFVSTASLKRYVERLEAGAEVTPEGYKEPRWLLMELAVGETVIGMVLQGAEPVDNVVEEVAHVTPGWMSDCRRPIEEAAQLLCKKYQAPYGYYTDIANFIRRHREELESRLQAEGYRTATRKFLVV